MPRFAANLSFLFTEVPFLERFAEAARAGFTAVEFAFPYAYAAKDVLEQAKTHGLQVVLINAPPGDWDAGERGTASLWGREHEFAAGIATGLNYARVLHCTRLHVMAGVVKPDADPAVTENRRAQQRAVFVRNLRYACAEAAGAGVTVLLEALNPIDVPHYLYTTQAEAHALRTEVGAGNLKVQMDLYHTQRVEGGLSEKLTKWLPDIGHIQIAGAPDRHEPDIGEINYPYLFELLDELGYAGFIGCEYRPATTTWAGLNWRERLLGRP